MLALSQRYVSRRRLISVDDASKPCRGVGTERKLLEHTDALARTHTNLAQRLNVDATRIERIKIGECDRLASHLKLTVH